MPRIGINYETPSALAVCEKAIKAFVHVVPHSFRAVVKTIADGPSAYSWNEFPEHCFIHLSTYLPVADKQTIASGQ